MITQIKVIDNTANEDYPQWIDYVDNGIKSSIRVDDKKQKESILLKVLEIKLEQEKKIHTRHKRIIPIPPKGRYYQG
jgi:hypothetical protein